MFRLIIAGNEGFNEKTREFVSISEEIVMDLEHSLISLSKWESEYQKPFLAAGKKSFEEFIGYLKAMVVTPDVDLEALDRCTQRNIDQIQAYIDSNQSATTFGRMPESRGPVQVITSELIYYWMVAFNIPWEAEYWHLSRLFSLIRICNDKNSKPKKMSRQEAAEERARINAERRAKSGSKG